MWNQYLSAANSSFERSMKLMGLSKLQALNLDATQGASGTIAALSAELAAAIWVKPEDVVASYPAALVNGSYVLIAISDQHAVELIANYKTGMILIDSAGSKEKIFSSRSTKGRKAA